LSSARDNPAGRIGTIQLAGSREVAAYQALRAFFAPSVTECNPVGRIGGSGGIWHAICRIAAGVSGRAAGRPACAVHDRMAPAAGRQGGVA
jgi:hypothetical protein